MGLSQSERIVWLATELSLTPPPTIIHHSRDPVFSPQSIKALHPAGTAPVIVDDPSPLTGSRVVLAESGAIIEYLLAAYGKGSKLAPRPEDRDGDVYVRYLEWFHFANGTAQPTLLRLMTVRRLAGPEHDAYRKFVEGRWERVLDMLEERLRETGKYLAGEELTAADVMMVFTLTTMRGFVEVEFEEERRAGLLGYLRRVGEREGYREAMRVCEGEGFRPLLEGKVEQFNLGR
ncbi:MAG: hypothetical protein Q9227_008416 [Pyrenula ochraceoflavens]